MNSITYAIGDIHGRSDLLDSLLEQIELDAAARRRRANPLFHSAQKLSDLRSPHLPVRNLMACRTGLAASQHDPLRCSIAQAESRHV